MSALLSTSIIAASVRADEWQGRMETLDGVVHVSNPSEPIHDARTVELEELWRIGGWSEAEGELFGMIIDLVADEQGRVYVLDVQLSEVKVFSPEGRFLHSLGREGPGPGEFHQPMGLFLMPDGRLAVLQHSPTRVDLFDPEGTYAGDLPTPEASTGGYHVVSNVQCRGAVLAMRSVGTRMQTGAMDQITRVIRADFAGKELAEYARSVRHFDFAELHIKERETNLLLWTLGPGGNVFLNPDYDYRIEVLRPDGDPERVITREYEHRPRSDEDRKRVRDSYGTGRDMQGVSLEISDHDRDVTALYATDDGQLWVSNSRDQHSLSPGVLGRFDVFNAEGCFERRLSLAGDYDPEQDRYIIAGERVYVLKRWADATGAWRAEVRPDAYSGAKPDDEEPEPMSVVCFRIPLEAFR